MSVLKKMGKNSTNDRVYSLVWCPDDDEDVSKQSSNLKYMDSSQDLVKIRHMSPDVIGSMIGDIIGDMMGKMIGDVICR